MAAALSLSACDLIGAGRAATGERNESASENSSSNSASTSEGNSSRSEDEGSERSTRSDEDSGNRSEDDRGSRDERETNEERDSGASSSRGGSQLERDLEAAVRRQQGRLPMRDGSSTITAMEADGNRLIITMNIDEDFGEAEWDEMAATLQREICGDGPSRQMIGRGAEVLYRITDGDGERVNMRTTRCD
jgi:hypothetical protein